MHEPLFIHVCAQRHSSDCGVCCFVMLCGLSYEAALVAMVGVDEKLATNGLYFTQIKKAAQKLGIKLKSLPRGRYDLSDAVGILSVKFRDKTEHAVVVFRGCVIDPEGGVVWDDVLEYIEHSDVKLGSLLIVA